jgi:hypothetical protein
MCVCIIIIIIIAIMYINNIKKTDNKQKYKFTTNIVSTPTSSSIKKN